MDAHLPISLRDMAMRFPPSGKGPLRGTPDGVGHKWPVKHEKMKM